MTYAAMAAGEIEYDDFASEGYPYDPDDPADSAVLIHFVGSNSVNVCKRPLPGRVEQGVPTTRACCSCVRPLSPGQLPDWHCRRLQ